VRICPLSSRPRGIERSDYRHWVFCNHGQESASRSFRRSSATLPVLDSVYAEAEDFGKPCLGHVQVLADSPDVYMCGDGNFIALAPAAEKGIDLFEAFL